jgi:hypothetical protein
MMGASSFSVAWSRSSRLRARPAADTGLRQTISRSPGKSGLVISARSCWSKRLSWSGPPSAISFLMAGARSAVIHSPGSVPGGAVLQLVQRGDPGAGDHAPVADHDHLGQAERVPDHLDDLGEGGRVAGVAGEDPDRDRAAFGVGQQPVVELQFPFLAVPGVAAGGQRAVRALQPRAGQVEQRHPRRVRGRGQVPAGQPGLDRVLPAVQPVHRRVDVISGCAVHAQVGAQRGIGPPGQGGQHGCAAGGPGEIGPGPQPVRLPVMPPQSREFLPQPPGRHDLEGVHQPGQGGLSAGSAPAGGRGWLRRWTRPGRTRSPCRGPARSLPCVPGAAS